MIWGLKLIHSLLNQAISGSSPVFITLLHETFITIGQDKYETHKRVFRERRNTPGRRNIVSRMTPALTRKINEVLGMNTRIAGKLESI